MKKTLALTGIAFAGVLALTGCGSNGYDGYSTNGGWSDSDWDMNNSSVYNNNTYCGGGTYMPMNNNQFACNRNGVTSAPSARPVPVIPPKSAQKPPVKAPAPAQKPPAQNSAPKAPAPAPKAPAPAPKAPAAKTGK